EYELRLSHPPPCKVWDGTVLRPDEHVDSDEREVFHEQVDTLGRARKLFAELRKLYRTISRDGIRPGSSPGAARLTIPATVCMLVSTTTTERTSCVSRSPPSTTTRPTGSLTRPSPPTCGKWKSTPPTGSARRRAFMGRTCGARPTPCVGLAKVASSIPVSTPKTAPNARPFSKCWPRGSPTLSVGG